MPDTPELLLGEYPRTLDDRHRLSVPTQLADLLTGGEALCILAKERPGCLSLWDAAIWRKKLDVGVELVRTKIKAGRLAGRVDEVQRLGRLLSTRHTEVQLAGRGRLVIPEGFREFLGVEPGGDVLVVGAAVCVEIWRPEPWQEHVAQEIAGFRELLEELSG